ncbi:MAG: hypothetical protein JW940_26200 [Polyangiaceae bacterium]|nr:hypothetical protein [Polyangiaceae bacterium]
MASAESPEGVVHRFASLLEAAGVPYMLTGSFASGFHGAPRATQAIDIVISPTLGTLNRLLRLLPDDKYYVSREAALDAYGRESLFNVVDFASGWKIDLICRKARAFSVTEFERRTRRDVGGVGIYLASAEDVVLAKLEWAKQGRSERQLEDAASIVRIQGEHLDVAYVEQWVDRLEVRDEWRKSQMLALAGYGGAVPDKPPG